MAGASAAMGLAGCLPASLGKLELDFWAMGREAEVVKDLLPGFYQRHPNIRVRVQQIPWSSAHEKLLTAYVGNSLPDLFQLGNTWIAEMAQLDILLPLQSAVDASRVVQTPDYFEGILKTNVASRIAPQTQGATPQLLGLPWYVDTRLLFYRRDLLSQAGFAEPAQNWADWAGMLDKLKERQKGKGNAIFLAINEFELLLALALQQEAPLLRDGDTRGNFSNPDFRRSLTYYSDMFRNGWAELQGKEQISNLWTEFGKGRFAFFVSGPWSIGELKRRLPPEQQDSWGCAPLPGPQGPGTSVAGGASLVIHRHSRKKEAAWELLEYLNEPAVQAQFYGLTGNLPPRMSTWQLAKLDTDDKASAFAQQLQRVKPAPPVLEWERVVIEMQRAAENMIRGKQNMDTTLAMLDGNVDDILAKRRWLVQQAQQGRVL